MILDINDIESQKHNISESIKAKFYSQSSEMGGNLNTISASGIIPFATTAIWKGEPVVQFDVDAPTIHLGKLLECFQNLEFLLALQPEENRTLPDLVAAAHEKDWMSLWGSFDANIEAIRLGVAGFTPEEVKARVSSKYQNDYELQKTLFVATTKDYTRTIHLRIEILLQNGKFSAKIKLLHVTNIRNMFHLEKKLCRSELFCTWSQASRSG